MITKCNFSKIAETAHRASSTEAGLFIKFNSYSFNFNGGLRKHRAGYCLLRTPGPRGKQFLRFLKTDLLRFHRIYLLFDFNMCLLRINLPNLCPNMNHFDSVDFSECHSEKVMFLLTLSLVRKFLNRQSTERLIHAFVTSHLDYCNSLYSGLPLPLLPYNMCRIQQPVLSQNPANINILPYPEFS